MIDECQRFWHYLNNYGYPPESIVRNYRVGNHIADFATIDPESGRPLAFFDIKLGCKGGLSRAKAAAVEKQLLEMQKAVAPFDVSLWYVNAWPKQAANTVFKVPFERDNQGQLVLETGRPPDFESIDLGPFQEEKARTGSASKQNILKKRRESVDWFQRISWGAAIVVFLLFLAEMFDLTNLEAIEISLLVFSVALALAPFAARFKVLGLEFERLQTADKEVINSESKELSIPEQKETSNDEPD